MSDNVHILDRSDSVLSHFLAEIRDTQVQGDRLRFRRNIERVGEIIAYEISKTLGYRRETVQTPLAGAECSVLAEQPVLATILRAGLPLHQGLLNIFDGADNTFISAYRKHHENDDSFDVEIEYLSSPPLDGRTVILCDPMLATGSSMVLAWKALLARGTPAKIHVASVIASTEGVEFTRDALPGDTEYWLASVDEELTPRKYIVPGLGDAGDLCYGVKE